MSTLLEVQKLEAFYGAGQVLHGIGLSIARGEQVALLGRNGMGKTTLLRSLMGLVADRRGQVTLNGRDIMRAAPETIARAGVALVPEGRGVFGSLSVVENLVMAARPGIDGRKVWTLEKIYELFPRLHARRSNGGHQLSGGEQQMLSMARTLLGKPSILLLDEPLEGLAPVICDQLMETISRLATSGDMTIILVEQQIERALNFADRVMVVERGRAVWEGASDELKSDRSLVNRLLGVGIH